MRCERLSTPTPKFIRLKDLLEAARGRDVKEPLVFLLSRVFSRNTNIMDGWVSFARANHPSDMSPASSRTPSSGGDRNGDKKPRF